MESLVTNPGIKVMIFEQMFSRPIPDLFDYIEQSPILFRFLLIYFYLSLKLKPKWTKVGDSG